jgi:hypothetical protein
LRRTSQPLVRGHGRCRRGSVEHPLSAGSSAALGQGRRPAPNGPRAGAGAPKGDDGDTSTGAARVAS